MLTIKEEGLLLGIIKHCDKILQKMNNVSEEQFNKNDDLIQIVCFNILQIGELTKNLDVSILVNLTKFLGNRLQECEIK